MRAYPPDSSPRCWHASRQPILDCRPNPGPPAGGAVFSWFRSPWAKKVSPHQPRCTADRDCATVRQNLSHCVPPIEPLGAKLITRRRTVEQTPMATAKIALDDLRELAVKRGLV